VELELRRPVSLCISGGVNEHVIISRPSLRTARSRRGYRSRDAVRRLVIQLVAARHDAIRVLVEAAQDQISMPRQRRARFGNLPYIDLTQIEQEHA
jgi:hypothetical protein